MFDFITVGDAVCDIFVNLNKEELSVLCPHSRKKGITCHEPVLCLGYGDKIPIEDVHFDIGGSAANVSVALSRLGFKTSIVTAIGRDERGKEILDKLEKENVSTSHIPKFKEVKTSFSVIINFHGERTILVHRGLLDYSKLKFPQNLNAKWVFVGPLGHGWEKLYTEIASLAGTKNIKLALNPGGIQIKEKGSALRGILKIASILFVNKEEAEELLEIKRVVSIKDLLSSLKKMGPEIVIITDGPEGAYAFDGETYLTIGPSKAVRKEATGAGDAFSSGFLGGLLLAKDPKEALQWGVTNTSGVIENIGAQKGLSTKRQIEKNLKDAPIPRPI